MEGQMLDCYVALSYRQEGGGGGREMEGQMLDCYAALSYRQEGGGGGRDGRPDVRLLCSTVISTGGRAGRPDVRLLCVTVISRVSDQNGISLQ